MVTAPSANYAYLHDKPDSIGVGETQGWPTLMVVHEIGHFVDHVGLPGVRYQSVERAMAEMDGVPIAAPWASALLRRDGWPC